MGFLDLCLNLDMTHKNVQHLDVLLGFGRFLPSNKLFRWCENHAFSRFCVQQFHPENDIYTQFWVFWHPKVFRLVISPTWNHEITFFIHFGKWFSQGNDDMQWILSSKITQNSEFFASFGTFLPSQNARTHEKYAILKHWNLLEEPPLCASKYPIFWHTWSLL